MVILVAGAMIVREGEILLGRRSPHRRICPNTWDLIGGHLEAGETADQALVRELGEEIGVEPTDYRLLGVIDFTLEAGEPLHFQLYRVDAFKGTPRLLDDEHTELRWFDSIEAAALPDLASPRYRSFLTSLAAEGGQ